MIINSPYPLFMLTEFLDKELHKNLKKSFPSKEDLIAKGISSSKNRYNFMRGSNNQKVLIDSSSSWALFDEYIKNNFIKDMLGFIKEKYSFDYENILKNTNLECHYDISRAEAGYVRSCHIDRRHHLMSFLYYLNDQNEYKGKGGNFISYEVERPSGKDNIYDVFPDPKNIKSKKVIRPKENSLVGFINVKNAYHGVSKMTDSVSDRMFLYISIDSVDKQPIWKNENIKVLSEKRRQDFLNE